MEQQPVKPTFTIPMDGYTATLEKGAWKYKTSDNIEKANQAKPIAKYKDPVQFKIMEKYEALAKSKFQKQLGVMVVEMVKYLNSL